MKTALYRHFDQNKNLLYIGISLSAATRLAQHMSGSAWAKDIASVEVEHFNTRKTAEQAEKSAIEKEQPIWNKIYNATTTKPIVKTPTEQWTLDDFTEAADAIERTIEILNEVVIECSSFGIARFNEEFYAVTAVFARRCDLLNDIPDIRLPYAGMKLVCGSSSTTDNGEQHWNLTFSSSADIKNIMKTHLHYSPEFDTAYETAIEPVMERYARVFEALFKEVSA